MRITGTKDAPQGDESRHKEGSVYVHSTHTIRAPSAIITTALRNGHELTPSLGSLAQESKLLTAAQL